MTTNSDIKMADESSLTLKVMSLEKGMGAIVKVMKELRTSVKLLEEKIVADHNEEIKGIKKETRYDRFNLG
jgi:hypothetical protein